MVELKRLLYTLGEAATMLALSEPAVRKLITNGELRSVKIGNARRVSDSAIHEYVARLEARAILDDPSTELGPDERARLLLRAGRPLMSDPDIGIDP